MRPKCLLFLWQDCEICAINHDAELHRGNPQKNAEAWLGKKKHILETKFTLSEEVKKKIKCFQVTTAGISMFVIHPASVNQDTVDTTHGTSPQDTKETNPGTASGGYQPSAWTEETRASTECSCSQVSPLHFTHDDDLPPCLSPPPNKSMHRQTKSSKLPTVIRLILDLLPLQCASESGHRNALGIICKTQSSWLLDLSICGVIRNYSNEAWVLFKSSIKM